MHSLRIGQTTSEWTISRTSVLATDSAHIDGMCCLRDLLLIQTPHFICPSAVTGDNPCTTRLLFRIFSAPTCPRRLCQILFESSWIMFAPFNSLFFFTLIWYRPLLNSQAVTMSCPFLFPDYLIGAITICIFIDYHTKAFWTAFRNWENIVHELWKIYYIL